MSAKRKTDRRAPNRVLKRSAPVESAKAPYVEMIVERIGFFPVNCMSRKFNYNEPALMCPLLAACRALPPDVEVFCELPDNLAGIEEFKATGKPEQDKEEDD